MIGKLLTLLVIGVMVWSLLKRRGERIAVVATKTQPNSLQSDIRLAAYLFIGVMVVISAGMFYLQWRDEVREVTVEVVNTHTGGRTSYRARFGDIEGRQFTTLEGRSISAAESERMEVLEPK